MSRRIIKDRMNRAANRTPRPFNGQIYDIPTMEYCRVLIQGSIYPVIARFNRNTHHYGEELKIGNAVLCQYKIDGRGEIEVIGHGTVIPTPIVGQPTVAIPGAENAVMTGCQVLALPTIY